MKILKAIWKIIKKIVFWLWVSVLLLEICFYILCRPRLFRHTIAPELKEYRWIILIMIVMWFLITFAYVWISDQIEAYQRDRYRKKYVRQVTWEDERFGKFVFDYDTKRLALESVSCDLPSYGGKKPYSLSVDMKDGSVPERVFPKISEALTAAYDREEEIVTACCEYVKEVYDSEDIRNEAGELISIETIRDTLAVTGFRICPDAHGVSVEILGDMNNDFQDHIAEHGVSMELRRDSDNGEWHFEKP